MRLPLVGAVACASVAFGIWLVNSGTLARAGNEFPLGRAACTFPPVIADGKVIVSDHSVVLVPASGVGLKANSTQSGLVWLMDFQMSGPRAVVHKAPGHQEWSAMAVFTTSGHYAMMTVNAKREAFLSIHSGGDGTSIAWSAQRGTCHDVEYPGAA